MLNHSLTYGPLHHQRQHANVSDNSNVHHTSYYRGAGGGHLDAQSVHQQ